ncbi:GNAT family N-acetyltransferase [Nocardioides daphniae]|uniref:N-acetyltransferase domain-containing protein n=1 Tax=Nocardioides daphniae TaxID=402297 RepID=A0ABQ1QIV4_9ACTN|nr:GNAT family N-acetyltransferase [Nocardioides daphniae]GGD28158.1 hypothetical protein GCM10007231_29600 [Nocardioides daphniae]
MDLRISPADFDDLALPAFLTDHLAELEPTAPAESRHALDLDGLRAPGVRLWVAHADGPLVATGATAALAEPGHEEVKSMRIAPSHRGRGVARRMVEHLVRDARARGVTRLWLGPGAWSSSCPRARSTPRWASSPAAPTAPTPTTRTASS